MNKAYVLNFIVAITLAQLNETFIKESGSDLLIQNHVLTQKKSTLNIARQINDFRNKIRLLLLIMKSKKNLYPMEIPFNRNSTRSKFSHRFGKLDVMIVML